MAATTPTNGGSYANTYAVNAAGRVHKLAETIIHKVDAVNPLSFMMRPELKTGDTIEENIIALVNKTAFTGTHTDKPYTAADVKTKYFRSWNKGQYRASVQYSELAEVSENESQINEIMETVVSTITASEGNDDYEDCKALLKSLAILGQLPCRNSPPRAKPILSRRFAAPSSAWASCRILMSPQRVSRTAQKSAKFILSSRLTFPMIFLYSSGRKFRTRAMPHSSQPTTKSTPRTIASTSWMNAPSPFGAKTVI